MGWQFMGADQRPNAGSYAAGWVYILSNPAYKKNRLKIGMTTRSPAERAKELSRGTGVAGKFRVEHVVWVLDCRTVEKLIHQRLEPYRYRKNREFFDLPLARAKATVNKVAATYLPTSRRFSVTEWWRTLRGSPRSWRALLAVAGVGVLFWLTITSFALAGTLLMLALVLTGFACFAWWGLPESSRLRTRTVATLTRPSVVIASVVLVPTAIGSFVVHNSRRTEQAALQAECEEQAKKANVAFANSDDLDELRRVHAETQRICRDAPQQAPSIKLGEELAQRTDRARKAESRRLLSEARSAASDANPTSSIAAFTAAARNIDVGTEDKRLWAETHVARALKLREQGADAAAIADLERATVLAPDLPGLHELRKEARETVRKADVSSWITFARDVARDRTRCVDIAMLQKAWSQLRQVRPEDAGYNDARSAAKRLERCRRKVQAGLLRARIAQRREYVAKLVETPGVRARARGKRRDQLRLVCPDDVWTAELRSKLTTLGFSRVVRKQAGRRKTIRLSNGADDRAVQQTLGELSVPVRLQR